jgi:hypothetical protein
VIDRALAQGSRTLPGPHAFARCAGLRRSLVLSRGLAQKFFLEKHILFLLPATRVRI